MKGIRLAGLMLMAAFLLGGAVVASADAPEFEMTPEAAQKAIEQGSEALDSQLADPEAAEQLPHHDLDRAQALELISSVFGTELEGVAGVFNDLDVVRFLSDNAAVIGSGSRPPAPGVVIGEEHYDGPALLESTVPLRTDDESGGESIVDLDLERDEGELQPAMPLVEVGIPSQLGEGIELPESDVQIELAGAPAERSPSIVNQTVAVYPEVADDTSFAVAPSPTGIETFTVLQSPSAPNSANYQLSLPDGASLSASTDGGAEVSRGEQPILRIFPPSALDAEGNSVPVSLEVSGNAFTVHAKPQEDAAYPILVDPVIESYNWYGTNSSTNLGDWKGSSNNQGLLYNTKSALGLPGTDVRAVNGFTLPYNAEAKWTYSVPRYASDLATFGAPPTSFISSMVLSNLFFVTNADKSLYPMMAAGIWIPSISNWASAWGHGGNTGNIENLGTTYTFGTTNQDAKQAISNILWAGEVHTMTSDRETYVGSATIELADQVKPGIGSFSPPTKWVNATAPGIPFVMTDSGLGISQIVTWDAAEPSKTRTTNQGCIGIVTSPCPRTWSENGTTSWLKIFDPSGLSQGIRKMKVVAKDPVGNTSNPYEFDLKVDHTAPSIALSGSMTEQAAMGSKRPSYVLSTTSTDGTEVAPQSGVASTEIKIDGQKVDSSAAGCATKNCSVTRNWTLESNAYSVGKHVVIVKATDGVGLTTEKTINIEIQRDTTKPTVESYGSLHTAPEGWVMQKSYSYIVSAIDKDYGVTSIQFKIDGAVAKSISAPCPAGNCSLSPFFTIDMSKYKGGAHIAQLVATDGAGNATNETWTVNVNPSGAVAAAEVIDTLEAVEGTNEELPVVPTDEFLDPGQIEAGDNPGLVTSGADLKSTGVPNTTVISKASPGEFTIKSPDGAFTVDPLAQSSGTAPVVSNEVAGVSANVGSGVDSVIRPEYNGALTFQAIRNSSSPEKWAWEVRMNEGQNLQLADPKHAEIVYDDGTRAMLITAEEAHDATGAAVPTSLEVSGNVLTLVVNHKSATFVYPVLAGQAFEAAYVLPIVVDPPPVQTTPPGEATPSQGKQIISPSNGFSVEAPPPAPSGGASASKIRLFEVKAHTCSEWGCDIYRVDMKNGYFIRTSDGVEWSTIPFECEADVGDNWHIGPFRVLSLEWGGIGYHKPYFAVKGGGHHLIAYCHFKVSLRYIPELIEEHGEFSLMDWVYPNGFQKSVAREVEPFILEG